LTFTTDGLDSEVTDLGKLEVINSNFKIGGASKAEMCEEEAVLFTGSRENNLIW